MASTYPGAVDSLVRPDSTDPLSDGHAALHNATSDAVEAVQTELGVNPSGSEATVAARLTAAESATSAAQATATAAVPKATYDAHTVLAATTDNTPAAVTVAEQTIVGRKTGGNITALTAAETKTLLGLGTAAVVDVPPSGDATSGQVVKGSDSRLSDARTPTAHKTSHQSGGGDELTLAQAQITNLTTDLSAKAPLANPTFTGTPAAPTAAVDTNTTQIATTAFTVAQIADDAVLKTVADAAGDLVVGSAADTFGRLALGTDNYALTVNTGGSGVAKVGWEDPTANPLTTAAMALKVNTATVGNLLTANQATGTDTLGNTTGFIDQGGSPTFVSSTDEAVSGTKSLKVTWNGTSTNYIEISGTAANNWFAVTPGSTITVKAMNKAGADTWAYRAFWYQANETASATSSTVHPVATQSASWHAADATFIAPADAAFMYVLLYRDNGVNGDITYFDNLSVHFGAGGQWALPGTPITNLGFYTDESCGRRLFQWDANNSRFQQTFGDTGWRAITASLENGWSAAAVYLRRTNSTVELVATTFTGAGASSGVFYTLPTGYAPISLNTYYLAAAGTGATTHSFLNNGSALTMAGTYTGVTSARLSAMWTTTAAWPTTLPGSAVGSIPA
jgi:hypothetical protein